MSKSRDVYKESERHQQIRGNDASGRITDRALSFGTGAAHRQSSWASRRPILPAVREQEESLGRGRKNMK